MASKVVQPDVRRRKKKNTNDPSCLRPATRHIKDEWIRLEGPKMAAQFETVRVITADAHTTKVCGASFTFTWTRKRPGRTFTLDEARGSESEDISCKFDSTLNISHAEMSYSNTLPQNLVEKTVLIPCKRITIDIFIERVKFITMTSSWRFLCVVRTSLERRFC